MLNGDLKKKAIKNFEKSKKTYEELGKKVAIHSEKLMNIRKNDTQKIILHTESLFSAIANRPKEFDKIIAEYKAEFKIFNDTLGAVDVL